MGYSEGAGGRAVLLLLLVCCNEEQAALLLSWDEPLMICKRNRATADHTFMTIAHLAGVLLVDADEMLADRSIPSDG